LIAESRPNIGTGRRRVRTLPRSHLVHGVGFTIVLLGLIALAISDVGSPFLYVLVAAVGTCVAFIHRLFPGSRLFSIALANLLGVYACLFQFFVATNFRPVMPAILSVGFAMPILAFLAGCWWRRNAIRAVVEARRVRGELPFLHALAWLPPVFAVGALTFLLPHFDISIRTYSALFLVAMAVISVIILAVSHNVATFLIDTGLLFEEFFQRVRHLVIPAFAFLTFFSLLVIVFASLYSIIDRYSVGAHFRVFGETRDIDFSEALYFSVVTIATVGYGDIVPGSSLVRVLATLEVVAGLVLLPFGFYEINAYAREQREGRGGKH
jgi:voltage-gated potassium channel